MVTTRTEARRGLRTRLRHERGGGDIFMLMTMMVLLILAGLAYDGGMAFNARREATNVAATAARAGANRVSTDVLYESGLAESELFPGHDAAIASMPIGFTLIEYSAHSGDEVVAKVSTTHEPLILGIVGIGTIRIVGEAVARVQNGPPPS